MYKLITIFVLLAFVQQNAGQDFFGALVELFSGNSGSEGSETTTESESGAQQPASGGGDQQPNCSQSARLWLEEYARSVADQQQASWEDFDDTPVTENTVGQNATEQNSFGTRNLQPPSLPPGTGPVKICPTVPCQTEDDCDEIQAGRFCQCGCCMQPVAENDGAAAAAVN